MSASASPLVFQFLFENVLGTLHDFVVTTASTMATVVGGAGTILFGLYVMFWGIAVLRGVVQEPLTDGFMRIMRGVFILAVATSAGIYSDLVIDFFWEIPGAIAAEVANPGSSAGYTTSSNLATAQMLDGSLGSGLKVAGTAWDYGTSSSILSGSLTYYLLSIVILLFVGIVCAYAGALVLVANMGLSIMLGLGPLFILCAMFEATQQLFVAWTRQVITFAVFFIVLAAAVSLTFAFLDAFMQTLVEDGINYENSSSIILNFAKLVVICAAALIVLVQSTSWASGLAGGVSVAAAGAVGGMVGKGTGAAAATGKAIARREYDPTKENKDGSRGGHSWRGAAPAAGRGAAKLAAYMRRNQIKKA